MRVGTAELKNEIFGLLREWCDALVRLQIDDPLVPSLDGAILCPACKRVHGRCHEAVYPLMFMAQSTGDEIYLRAAKKLYAWGVNMVCADGAVRNDAQSEWKGVTAFAAIALHNALFYHGNLLDEQEKSFWETRLKRMGEWLYENLRPEMHAYINYYAANAAAMALLGSYFFKEEYISLAGSLFEYCFQFVSENRLLCGEGHPSELRTPKECYAIDIGGYNPEETLPSLYCCAAALKNKDALDQCKALFSAQLKWMLPDGAWDNSMGTRVFKWTYWGSRTADGCQDAFFALGKTDPVFSEAALRNLRLYRRCTNDGLLYGGPDYIAHGEAPCLHHTFCHAKTLALALENGILGFERCLLPTEQAPPLSYYPELDTCKIAFGNWLADITAYDFPYKAAGHTSGGTLSLLWNKKSGPVIAAGPVDAAMREPHNQQYSVKPEDICFTGPRVEVMRNETLYGQQFDFSAAIKWSFTDEAVSVKVNACLCDAAHKPLPEQGACALEYVFTTESLVISGVVSPETAENARFILPVIKDSARAEVLQGELKDHGRTVFHLSPGFICTQYTVFPDQLGNFSVRLSV